MTRGLTRYTEEYSCFWYRLYIDIFMAKTQTFQTFLVDIDFLGEQIDLKSG